MDLLDYVEGEAKASAEFQVSCRDAVLKEVNTTVAGLFGGGIGALAYAVSLVDKPIGVWAAWAMAACSVYLFGLALGVVVCCLRTQAVWPPANDPGLLLDAEELQGVAPDEGLRRLRVANLRSKQRSIEKNRSANGRVAVWLDRFRVAAVVVPVVFATVGWVAQVAG